MGLSSQVEPPMLNTSEFKFSVILVMNKGRKYPDECFFNPSINKAFTVNQEFLIVKAK